MSPNTIKARHIAANKVDETIAMIQDLRLRLQDMQDAGTLTENERKRLLANVANVAIGRK